MKPTPGGANRQREMFSRSRRPTIPIEENHRLVLLTDTTDWTEMEQRAQAIRTKKLKNGAGRPPQLRALVGAVVLMATRKLTYRDAEDQIRHYAPARYLCGLTETEWTPDFTTIQDFTELMGEDGIKLINQGVVEHAVKEKLADPRTVVADMTAQEAAVPHPNEMGLMAGFLTSVAAASQKLGGRLKGFINKTTAQFKAAKQKVREYRLFAKTKAAKDRLMGQMANVIEKVNKQLASALQAAATQPAKLRKYAIVADAKLRQLQETMAKLLPQIRYWLRTGWVASGKIISLHIQELYSIVRGKVGKKVEFGLSWGITRLRGGFLLAKMAQGPAKMQDSTFAVQAVKDHMALFGKPPRAYAYDRAGHSAQNIAELKKLGVRDVALAPRGRTAWSVKGPTRERLIRERALVEAGIGTIKCQRYGFNKPAAKSAAMMGACGQRAVLGFNINKLVRELAARKEIEVVG